MTRTIMLMAIVLTTTAAQAAPMLPDKPDRWEYAELSFAFRPASKAFDEKGINLPAREEKLDIRWIEGTEVFKFKSWSDLAKKLNAKGLKNEGGASLIRLQILNILGSQGWELVDQKSTANPSIRMLDGSQFDSEAATLLFKRRVP